MKKLSPLLLLLGLVACGSEDSTETVDVGTDTSIPFRPELDVTVPDVGMDEGNTQPQPEDDAGTPEDAGTDTGPDPCAGGCTTGLTRCDGSNVQYCVADPDRPGCGIWEAPAPCASPQQTCIVNKCDFPNSCLDNDNDSYGPGCQAGPDCDDTNPNVHPRMTEVCDGVDNDCDGQTDETFNVGGSCSIGTGVCATPGELVCSATGDLVCNATGTPGSPEICDGVDNDCDGQTDEDDVCGVCSNDPNEPNDTLATATALTTNVARTGLTCPADAEYFALTTANNKVYRVSLNYYGAFSELDMELLANGTVVQTAATVGDNETIQFTAQPNTNYAVNVLNTGNQLNAFRLAAVDGIPCVDEDTFFPNMTRTTSAFLFSGWMIEGHVCDVTSGRLSDWYFAGEIKVGEEIDVYLFDVDGFGDLDLYLHHDPDGDGNFTVAASSIWSGNDEILTYAPTVTGPAYIEVRDYDGDGASYELLMERF
jgi:hypothetical protein